MMLLALALAAWPAAARVATGEVTVVSAQPGAAIVLDGEQTGLVTPQTLTLAAGNHRIRLTRGCDVAETTTTVRGGQQERIELQLAPGTGTLGVTGEPAGAEVLLDGVRIGQTPLTGVPAACGPHHVRVALEGWSTLEQEVTIGLSTTTTVDATLVRWTPGSLSILVTPLEAEVLVDGTSVGTGPRSVRDLAPGPHAVLAQGRGYTPRSMQVQVEAGAVTRVVLDLERARLAWLHQPGSRLDLPNAALDLGLAAASLGLAAGSISAYTRSEKNYDVYVGLSAEDDHEAYFDEHVLGPRRTGRALALSALAAGIGSAACFSIFPVFGPGEVGMGVGVGR
jgi:hypothetical protein